MEHPKAAQRFAEYAGGDRRLTGIEQADGIKEGDIRVNLSQTEKEALVAAAVKARENSYSPYSGYKVGAAVLTATGKTYTGCNVENAVHAPAICAERVAIAKAVSEGERVFVAAAVATSNGAYPCGVCRQALREFCQNILVLVANAGGCWTEVVLTDLLPESFGPEDVQRRQLE